MSLGFFENSEPFASKFLDNYEDVSTFVVEGSVTRFLFFDSSQVDSLVDSHRIVIINWAIAMTISILSIITDSFEKYFFIKYIC